MTAATLNTALVLVDKPLLRSGLGQEVEEQLGGPKPGKETVT